MKSEITRIRQEIQDEYEAAQRGLSGFASGTARHNFITARTENIGALHEQLVELVGPDQAIAIVASTIWSEADQGAISNEYADLWRGESCSSRANEKRVCVTMILLRWLGWHRQSRPLITWEPTRPVSQVTDGRRRLIEQPYALPKDSQEEQRLTFQHHALYTYLHRHYFAPLQIPAIRTILDVGCGPGAWLRDMALLFPGTKLIGLDCDSEQLPRAAALAPPSCSFVQGDILKGLPFSENSIDYTHMRCMVIAIPALFWITVISELVRVTRPGGYIELFEGGQACSQAGPCMRQILSWGQKVGEQAGFDLLVIERLSILLRQAGLRHVREQRFNVPIGAWGGRAGELMALDLQAIFQALKVLLCTCVPIAPEQFDAIVQALPSEWEQYHTSYTYIMTYGQKEDLMEKGANTP